jgi:hypothetical protein
MSPLQTAPSAPEKAAARLAARRALRKECYDLEDFCKAHRAALCDVRSGALRTAIRRDAKL